jgi:hypothetical protein
MTKALLTGVAALFLATGTAHAGPRVIYCSGEWTDMRAIGLTIGACDINSISDKKFKLIRSLCGEPWNPSDEKWQEKNAPHCRIKAIVIPFTNQRGAKVLKAVKVLEP